MNNDDWLTVSPNKSVKVGSNKLDIMLYLIISNEAI